MFQLFLILITLTVTCTQNTYNDLNQLERFYYNKCLTNSGSTRTFEKFQNDFYETAQYFKLVFQILPSQIGAFCKTERDNLLHRAKEIRNDLLPCMTSKEQYLPSFMETSFEYLLHFLCHNNGKYTKRLFDFETTECRRKIVESDSKEVEYCFNRIFPPSKGYIVQKELCESISVGQKCIDQLIAQKCPNSVNTKNLNAAFFRYVSKPCSSCIFLSSYFVTFGVLLMLALVR